MVSHPLKQSGGDATECLTHGHRVLFFLSCACVSTRLQEMQLNGLCESMHLDSQVVVWILCMLVQA